MSIQQQDHRRLVAHDFVALRSLARSRWQQGGKIEWKFNGRWRVVTYSEAPALEAAERLMAMGLVDDTLCSCGCGRSIVQLTDRGTAFVAKLNEWVPARGLPPAEVLREQSPDKYPDKPGWGHRIWRALVK